MTLIEITDINVLSDIAIVASCMFLFWKWRKKNYSFAISFIPIAFFYATSSFLNIFDIATDVDIFVRALNSLLLTASLAHACVQILPDCKKLLPVFGLYVLVPLSLLFTSDVNYIYVFLRLIGFIILLPYFVMLFAFRHREIKIISFLGISAVLISGLFWITILALSSVRLSLPWFIPKMLFAFMLLGLAHYTIHMPDGLLVKDKRRRRK